MTRGAEWDEPLPTEQHDYDGLARLALPAVHARRERVFLLLAGLFLGTLAILNLLGVTRFVDLSFELPGLGWTVPMPLAVGVLPYPLTFLCTDFISELYGKRRANRVVWIGLLLNVWVVTILWVGSLLPPQPTLDASTGLPPIGTHGRVFFEVKQLTFGAVAASMVAYLCAQLVDVKLFHFYKTLTRGKHLWLRNNGSTMVSQLVDTVAVILITHFYAHNVPIKTDEPLWPQLFTFIAAGYVFKFVAALLDTFPFYVGAVHLARYLRLPPPAHTPHPSAISAVQAGVG